DTGRVPGVFREVDHVRPGAAPYVERPTRRERRGSLDHVHDLWRGDTGVPRRAAGPVHPAVREPLPAHRPVDGPAGYPMAAHRTHSTDHGRASRRSSGIARPHRSHRPYVPSSSFTRARATSARIAASCSAVPTRVSRSTASVVPSPIRLPKDTDEA